MKMYVNSSVDKVKVKDTDTERKLEIEDKKDSPEIIPMTPPPSSSSSDLCPSSPPAVSDVGLEDLNDEQTLELSQAMDQEESSNSKSQEDEPDGNDNLYEVLRCCPSCGEDITHIDVQRDHLKFKLKKAGG
jgi:hypothetical protein